MNHYPDYAGGALDREAEELLDVLSRAPSPPPSSVTPASARASFVAPSWSGERESVAATREVAVPGPAGCVPVRVHVPHGHPPFPVAVFFHGGGFVAGTLDDFDPFCTMLSARAGCLVASVGYRLAPEHRFPAAVEDALAAVRWLGGRAGELGGVPGRVALVGDSAGANLAAVAAQALRGAPPRVVLQVLVSPWVDLASCDTESFRLFGRGPWLSAASIEWYRGHYLASVERALEPQVSPLLAQDLSGLPPALVLNAEFDVLRDQAASYAERLRAAGTPVRHRLYPGTLHDFVVLPGLFRRASAAIDDIAEALREAFAEEFPQ